MIWHAAMDAGGSVETYLKELVWREYAANVILQFPEYGVRNARAAFDHFPWRDMANADVQQDYVSWTKGLTGYPIFMLECVNYGRPVGCTTASG